MNSPKTDVTESQFQEIEKLLDSVAEQFKSSSDAGFLKTITKIGKYRVNSLLGFGGQAACFLASDDELKRPVVIKLYRGGLTDELRTRILREGQALAQVNSPHVSTCYAVERFENRPFLVLEYIKGEPLEEWVKGRDLSVSEVNRIVLRILNGLEAVHSKGLLHLDLKPSNIIVDENDEAVLIDFGLSQAATAESGMQVTGTPSYIAPERIIGNAADHRTDIYGIGALIFFLIAKRAPFVAATKEDTLKKIVAEELDWEDIDPENRFESLIEIGKKCMSQSPPRRFQNTGEIAEAFLTGACGVAIESRQKRTSRSRFVAAGIAAALLLLAVAAYSIKGSLIPASWNSLSAVFSADQSQQIGDHVSVDWFKQVAGGMEFSNDFSLNCVWKPQSPTVPTEEKVINWSSKYPDGPAALSMELDQIYSLETTPDVDCHIAVFSLEFADGSENINHVELVAPSGTENEITKQGETFRCLIRAGSLTPSNKQELLWVFASSVPFDPAIEAEKIRLELTNDANSLVKRNVEWATSGVMRGLEKVDSKKQLVAGTVVPYCVE